MLAGVQAQQSELLLSTFTSDYVSLMRTSSKLGSTLSEKQVESVVNSYQSRLDGSHAAASLLSDSAEDTLEATMDSSQNFLTQDDGGPDPNNTYAALFGMETAGHGDGLGKPAAPIGTPAPPVQAAAPTVNLPDVPTGVPGSHRRTPSMSVQTETSGALDWMLAPADDCSGPR